MPQIGPLEIFMIAAVALIVFGPQKLPEIARTVGRFMQQMRRMASEVKTEFETGLDDPDDDEVADEDAEAIEEAAEPAEPAKPEEPATEEAAPAPEEDES
jgi:Tat protein translocase TatB subunit